MKIDTILDQIDLGSIALPEFQRGYVWNREQVRGLLDSLYRRHPVGSLLVWVGSTGSARAVGNAHPGPVAVHLLLDGSQGSSHDCYPDWWQALRDCSEPLKLDT